MLGGVAALSLAALIGGTVMGVRAANGTFDNIYAKNIFLKDNSGKVGAELRGNGGHFSFYNHRGKMTAMLLGDVGILSLMNSRGKHRVRLDGNTGQAIAFNFLEMRLE